MKLAGSSSLELQMQLANPATSIVANAVKTFRCWHTVHMKSWGTSKVTSILSETSDWHWRHLLDGYWTLRETPSVRMSWSVRESAFFGVLWSFGIESILSPKIRLLTIVEPRMPRCQYRLRCRRWLKCWNWAAPTSWFTNCGHNSPWLPAAWTLTSNGSAMRCWLVISLFHVSSCPCATAYWCGVLVDHSEWNVPPHLFSCARVGEGSWTVQHRIWGARLRDLGDGVEVGEVHFWPSLCCGVEPT